MCKLGRFRSLEPFEDTPEYDAEDLWYEETVIGVYSWDTERNESDDER